jgi:hypothetical protein
MTLAKMKSLAVLLVLFVVCQSVKLRKKILATKSLAKN